MTYPAHLRSYLNSDQPADIERALAECAQQGIDYQQARALILSEMVAEYEANEPARERRRADKATGGLSARRSPCSEPEGI